MNEKGKDTLVVVLNEVKPLFTVSRESTIDIGTESNKRKRKKERHHTKYVFLLVLGSVIS